MNVPLCLGYCCSRCNNLRHQLHRCFWCASDPGAAADIFFKTTQCLREDTSGCFDKTNENYMITHSGLDAQVCVKVAKPCDVSSVGSLPGRLCAQQPWLSVWLSLTMVRLQNGLDHSSKYTCGGSFGWPIQTVLNCMPSAAAHAGQPLP